MTATSIDVPTFINERTVGRFQLLVVALCALTVFLDGFDTQSIAFVAPSIAREWQLPREALGPIFVASLVGLLIGALLFGPVADKVGRRWVVMICTTIFGVFTIVTATSTNETQLLIFRFITGLGLGGAMPNAIALTAEYCPERRRATLVMIMFTGWRCRGRRSCRCVDPTLRLALGVVCRRAAATDPASGAIRSTAGIDPVPGSGQAC